MQYFHFIFSSLFFTIGGVYRGANQVGRFSHVGGVWLVGWW